MNHYIINSPDMIRALDKAIDDHRRNIEMRETLDRMPVAQAPAQVPAVLSPVFNSTAFRPYHAGVYKVAHATSAGDLFAYYDGTHWYWWARTTVEAYSHYSFGRRITMTIQPFTFQGLAKDPSPQVAAPRGALSSWPCTSDKFFTGVDSAPTPAPAPYTDAARLNFLEKESLPWATRRYLATIDGTQTAPTLREAIDRAMNAKQRGR